MSKSTKQRPLSERFWEKVAIGEPDECWEWEAYRQENGYGTIKKNRKDIGAHRVSWELENGREVPDGMVVMHSCDNPSCVNPAHLSVGTQADNLADCKAKGRANTYTKFSADQVERVRQLANMKWTQRRISEEMGISQQHVSQLIREVRR